METRLKSQAITIITEYSLDKLNEKQPQVKIRFSKAFVQISHNIVAGYAISKLVEGKQDDRLQISHLQKQQPWKPIKNIKIIRR